MVKWIWSGTNVSGGNQLIFESDLEMYIFVGIMIFAIVFTIIMVRWFFGSCGPGR